MGPRLLLLPGGFWTVDGPGDVGPLADRQVDEAGWAGDLVIGGIDVMGRGAKGIHAKTSGALVARPRTSGSPGAAAMANRSRGASGNKRAAPAGAHGVSRTIKYPEPIAW